MNFGRLKVDQKIEPPIFVLANIEYVVSAQDFYAVQVKIEPSLDTFFTT